MGVTFYEEMLDISCVAVTPPCSKGALGTWRSQCGARTQCREHAALEARTSLWVNQRFGGVYIVGPAKLKSLMVRATTRAPAD